MRISGITIPDDKRLAIGLTALYGVGRGRALAILDEAGIDADMHAKELDTDQENKIREVIGAYQIEGDLKRDKSGNIKRLKDIGAYRGSRHSKGLPTRGQRTKSNSRTMRGNKRATMGSGKRAVEKK